MGEIEKRIWGLLRANPFLVLGGVILSLLLVFFWWKLPRWLLAPSKDLLEPADFLRLENDIRTSFTQAIGVIALFIGIPVAWFNLRAQKENQRHQLRLAALDKRLAVHQEAYMLWRKFAAKENFQEVARECDKWWDQNCLYLEADAQRAFRQAYYCAFYIEAIEAGRHSISLAEGWRFINEAGDVILKAVELPSLGDGEHKLLKDGEGKGSQPANPDSAG